MNRWARRRAAASFGAALFVVAMMATPATADDTCPLLDPTCVVDTVDDVVDDTTDTVDDVVDDTTDTVDDVVDDTTEGGGGDEGDDGDQGEEDGHGGGPGGDGDGSGRGSPGTSDGPGGPVTTITTDITAGGAASTAGGSVQPGTHGRAVIASRTATGLALARTATGLVVMLVLLGLAGGFVSFQHTLDRRDPKLAPGALGSDRVPFA